MDNIFTVGLSGIPNKFSELALDTAIMTHELLWNTLQSTGLHSDVHIHRTIGAKNFAQAFESVKNANCKIHVLFAIDKRQEPAHNLLYSRLTTLQRRDARLYNYFVERFCFNNIACRFISLDPANPSNTIALINESFERGCDYITVNVGSFCTTQDLSNLSRYAPAVARASAQAIYRYLTESLVLPKRQGLPPSPAPYSNQPSLYNFDPASKPTQQEKLIEYIYPRRKETVI